jgi:hypothetical protein
MLVSGCSGLSSVSNQPESEDTVNSGSWYVREQWPHDGHPYEGDRFVVYSDSASLEARRDVADRAERLWTEILSEMSIDSEMLILPSGQEKIHIYAFEDRSPEWAGKAYYGGLLISSPDRRSLAGFARTDRGSYESTFKHEMVHVASEALLHGRGLDEPPRVPVWFFEGLAEVMSTGNGSGAIRGRDHFDHLTSKYGHLNPVLYEHDKTVAGGPSAFTEYHYPMRQLAVEYLFDGGGYGIPRVEATALLVDMAGGIRFDAAFADHMGVTVAEYEYQFFELMNDYLPERSIPVSLTPVGLIVISSTLIGAAVVFTIRTIRISPGNGVVPQVALASRSSVGKAVGFTIWIAAASAMSLGVFLMGIYAVSVSWGLSGVGQVTGMAILITYFGAAAFAVNWAIRRYRRHSPIAWFIPLLALGGAVAAAVAIVIVLTIL